MSQLNQPSAFSSIVELSVNWTTRHAELGVKSPLIAKITDDGIDLAKLKTARDKAVQQEGLRVSYTEKAQSTRLTYKTHIELVTDFEHKFAQFLKRHYSKNPLQATDWGYLMTTNGKFNHPTDFEGIKTLLGKIDEKHTALAAKSPLLTFLAVNDDIDYAGVLTHATDAKKNQDDINDADKKVADYATERDKQLKMVIDTNKVIGSYLMSIYVGKPKLVRNFGFDVSEAGTKVKERNSTILPLETIQVNGVVKGSTFKNTGTYDLHIYGGKSTKGAPLIVKPNEEKGMNKGYSHITVMNPSDLIKGSYKVVVKV